MHRRPDRNELHMQLLGLRGLRASRFEKVHHVLELALS